MHFSAHYPLGQWVGKSKNLTKQAIKYSTIWTGHEITNPLLTLFPDKKLCGELISLMYAWNGKDKVQERINFEAVIIAILVH